MSFDISEKGRALFKDESTLPLPSPAPQEVRPVIQNERCIQSCHSALRAQKRFEDFKNNFMAPTSRGTRLFENPRSLLTAERAFQLPEPLKNADPPASLSQAEPKTRPSRWEKAKDFLWDLGTTLKGVFERRPWRPKPF